ncbi:manganese efflux pump [Lysinibacillus sp. NPDC095746]|uniref:manganese efflux pump n=1 Tax=Lysinibacillus sp. NPDC095746 TaxID=3364134 RepID=UPI00380E96B0
MLAEQASETVQKIQTVTSEVEETFTNVSINTQELLHFDNKVAPDYELFQNSGMQYKEDAMHFNEVPTFIGMLKYSMLEIQKAIENANVVIESSNQSNEIAKRISKTLQAIQHVAKSSVETANKHSVQNIDEQKFYSFISYVRMDFTLLRRKRMHWIAIILIGIAANLDNLGIGLAYGIKRVKIPILSNAVIALISMIVTYAAVTAGSVVINFISPDFANLIGSLLLCAIGIWTLLSSRFSKQGILGNPEVFDEDKNYIISIREAMTLGFVLSANCLAGGIALGANGISAIWTVISIGVFSFITVGAGVHFGVLLTKTFIGKHSTAISGWLLILIAIIEIVS